MSYLMESETEGRRIEEKTDAALLASQMAWVGAAAGDRVLDLGCAAGATTRILGKLLGPGSRVTGIDASPGRIAEARSHPAHLAWLDYRTGAAEAIPAAAAEFDVAWSRFLFEYLREPQRALAEMVRVTRPGGTVAVSDIDGNAIWHYPLPPDLAKGADKALATLEPIGFDPYAGRKLFTLFHDAGLCDVQVDVRPYHLIAGRIAPEAERLWRWKLDTVAGALVSRGWSAEEAAALVTRFLAVLADPRTFTYSILITVKGRRGEAAIPQPGGPRRSRRPSGGGCERPLAWEHFRMGMKRRPRSPCRLLQAPEHTGPAGAFGRASKRGDSEAKPE